MNYKGILDSCIELSHNQRDGCLFVIETDKVNGYFKSGQSILKERGKRFSVMDESDKKVIRKLAELDGAVTIDNAGRMRSFGATLLYSDKVRGHGKRHEFARGTTRRFPELTCVLASEEDRHIRIFEHGLLVVDMNGRSKNPVSTREKVTELLTSRTSQTLIASGVAASILTLNPLPAIITISGSHLLINDGFTRIKNAIKK